LTKAANAAAGRNQQPLLIGIAATSKTLQSVFFLRIHGTYVLSYTFPPAPREYTR
jgi:hypothetical protein